MLKKEARHPNMVYDSTYIAQKQIETIVFSNAQ